MNFGSLYKFIFDILFLLCEIYKVDFPLNNNISIFIIPLILFLKQNSNNSSFDELFNFNIKFLI